MGSVPPVPGHGRPGADPGVPRGAVEGIGHRRQRPSDEDGHDVGGQHRGDAGDPRRHQLPQRAPEQALGLHRQPGLQPLGADAEGAARTRRPGEDHGLRPVGELRPFPRSSRGVHLPEPAALGGLRRHRPQSGPREGGERADGGHHGARVQGPRRTYQPAGRAGDRQRLHQGHHGPGAQGALHAGPRRKGPGGQRSPRLQLGGRRAEGRQLRVRQARAGAVADGARRHQRGRHRRPAHRLLPRRNRRPEGLPGEGRLGVRDGRPGREGR